MDKTVWPTEHDKKYIEPLAQIIIDTVQAYALDSGLSFSGTLSAIATASGALIALAYKTPARVRGAALLLATGAKMFAFEMQKRKKAEASSAKYKKGVH